MWHNLKYSTVNFAQPSFLRQKLQSGSTSDTAESNLMDISGLPRKQRLDRESSKRLNLNCQGIYNRLSVSWVQPSSDRNEGWHDSDRQCFILKDHIYMRSAAAPAVADSVSPWFSVQIERTGRISGLQSTVCGISAGKEAKFFRVNLYQCLNSAWSADAPKKCCLFERHEVLWRPEIAPVR